MRVSLPLGRDAEDGHPPADAVAASLDGGAEELRGTKILVVEDDEEVANLLVLILQERGATVSRAGDFDSAVASLQAQAPDILVSDIGLPGKDGYALMRHIRQAQANFSLLPAIALTAFGREADRQAALAAGFNIHLAKPLQPQKLLAQIKSLVPGRPSDGRGR